MDELLKEKETLKETLKTVEKLVTFLEVEKNYGILLIE